MHWNEEGNGNDEENHPGEGTPDKPMPPPYEPCESGGGGKANTLYKVTSTYRCQECVGKAMRELIEEASINEEGGKAAQEEDKPQECEEPDKREGRTRRRGSAGTPEG